jgi:hypothetical protein
VASRIAPSHLFIIFLAIHINNAQHFTAHGALGKLGGLGPKNPADLLVGVMEKAKRRARGSRLSVSRSPSTHGRVGVLKCGREGLPAGEERTVTIAICVQCGKECAYMPATERDLIYSMALSDHYMDAGEAAADRRVDQKRQRTSTAAGTGRYAAPCGARVPADACAQARGR